MIGLVKVDLNASERPDPDARPKRAAISWSIPVATKENKRAHRSTKPKFAPATLAVAMLPGPIKAAVTNIPGPKRGIPFSSS
jgi:hypothetical protein